MPSCERLITLYEGSGSGSGVGSIITSSLSEQALNAEANRIVPSPTKCNSFIFLSLIGIKTQLFNYDLLKLGLMITFQTLS